VPAADNIAIALSSLELEKAGMSQNDTAKASSTRSTASSIRARRVHPGVAQGRARKELDTAMTKMADFRRFIEQDEFRLFFQRSSRSTIWCHITRRR